MNYYAMQRRLAISVRAWVMSKEPVPLSLFARKMRLEFGVSPKAVVKILNEDYPHLRVEDDHLVEVDANV